MTVNARNALAIAALLACAALDAGEPAALPKDWAFAGEFPGKPAIVLRAEAGNLSARLQELVPKELPHPGLILFRQVLPLCPKDISLAVWIEGRDRATPDAQWLAKSQLAGPEEAFLAAVGLVFAFAGDLKRTLKDNVWEVWQGDEAQPILSYAVKDGRLLCGTPKLVRDALSAAGPDRAGAFAWVAPLAPDLAMPPAEGAATLRAAVDFASLDLAALDLDRSAPVLRVLGLDGIGPRAALSASLDAKGLSARIASPIEGEPQGLVRLLFPKPGPLRFAELIPEDAFDLTCLSWGEAGELLDILGGIEKRWGEDVGKEYADELAELDRDLGFGFRKDLLSQFEGGGALAAMAPLSIPADDAQLTDWLLRAGDAWACLLSCREPEAVEKCLAKWLAYAKIEPARRDVDGVPVYDLKEKGGRHCAYALRDKVLYVAGSHEALAHVLRARGSGRTLAARPLLAERTKNGASAGVFRCLDIAVLGRAVQRVLDERATRLANAAAPPPPQLTRGVELLVQSGGCMTFESAFAEKRLSARFDWTGADPLGLTAQCVRLAIEAKAAARKRE